MASNSRWTWEEPMEVVSDPTRLDSTSVDMTDDNSNRMNTYVEEGNGGKVDSLNYDQSNGQEALNGPAPKIDSTTIYLTVVWPEEKSPNWERTLQKALQSWFNKNKNGTECLTLATQENGNAKVEIGPASGQEDLFIEETKLPLKEQTSALVKRVMADDFSPTSLTPSAPPMTVSCTLPLVDYWYVDQVCRETIICFKEENRVQIQPEVKVSFNVHPSTAGDPDKALDKFHSLVQSCLDNFHCVPYTYEELCQVDWGKAVRFIQQDEKKLTLTVSSHGVEVSGPAKSLEEFESVTKIQKKIPKTQSSAREAQGKSHKVNVNFRDPLVSSGLQMDPALWEVINTIVKKELAELELRFGVTFISTVNNKVKARVKAELTNAITLESHALRALLCLYQRVATSVMSCSLQSQASQANKEKEMLSGIPGVVPDLQGDHWRIIGLPDTLRQVVDFIENNMGKSIFKDEDKQRIGCSRYPVEPQGSSDIAGGKRPVGGATADEEEDTCPICQDSFKSKTTLKCKHMFCKKCLEESVKKWKPACPLCKTPFGTIIGDQPEGTMIWETQQSSLPGFKEHSRIFIQYNIHSALQTKQHPNPGKLHNGAQRSAYLPDNKEGREVLQLLKKAFDRKLIFTVGTSRTSGYEDQVTWNDVHHKTNVNGGPTTFGYPDPDYLRRVKDELKAKGVE